ncbi:Rne/Rng family ribonuclease [Micromonospora sp. NPDC000442]|uniref:Rne/Rng family ribonuclease n=1 Tax=Micromonospora sp. NPDC000442 TaxID=3364217 RepID=UPI0036BA40B5
MLENEPEGSERAGINPADESAENSTTEATGSPPPQDAAESGPVADPPEEIAGAVSGTADLGGVADLDGATNVDPAPRRRTTRRRATSVSRPEQTEAPVEASGAAAVGSGEAPQAEVFAPVSGDLDPAAKTPRRRRKATTGQKAVEEPLAVAEAEGTDSGVVPPVKVTRTRRRKSTPPPAEPSADAVNEPSAQAEPAQPAADAGLAPAAGTDFGSAALPAEGAADPEQAAEPAEAAEPVGAVAPESSAEPVGPAAAPAEPEGRSRRRKAALTAPTVLFMAPEEVLAARAAAAEPTEEEPAEEPAEPSRRRRRGRRETEPVVATETEEEPTASTEEVAEEEDDEETAAGRRRRRRGRRGRGRGKGGADDGEEAEESEAAETVQAETEEPEAESESESEEGDEGDGMTRRRRRRRRRGAGDTDGAADDGVPTVVKIREPRRTVDEVQGVSGSTRLEAKRQRRRDGREQRRTRPPILSESEFLARREAVDRVMAVRQRGDRTQIAVLEDGVLVEHYVTRSSAGTMAGNVYLGKVQNVLPSMEAAFVDIGRGRNAVLYAGEVNWDTSGLEGRARSIEQALRSGDSVLVQVTKDPIGHKGARLTSHIALSGRHLVYVPGGNASGISRKLPDTERKRLRDALKKLVPDGAGVIVRTAAEGASEDELARDVKRLQAQWEDIQDKAAEGGAPVLLYQEPDLVIRVVRDLFNEDFRELVMEGDEAYDMVESYLSHVSPDLVARLRRHVGTTDIFAEYRIDEQILKGLDRKVFLPSGGHLVIDRTEAMTVVDVNTGKYTGAGGNLEETVTRNNLEAAEEIVRQLRLRDIGGIVVIDFIDMVLESNRELVLRRLTECLGRDRTKHQVTEITSLGLVQMTRKRIGAGLLEAFSETCECCKGRGLVIHTEPVPEKPRSGGGDKVKAVASAGAPAAEQTTASSRRRARKNAASAERTVVEVTETDTTSTADADYHDTMGYDLSRYETDTPAAPDVADSQQGEAARLAAPDDPDALGETDEEGGTGRRRSRRGAARRRTRP